MDHFILFLLYDYTFFFIFFFLLSLFFFKKKKFFLPLLFPNIFCFPSKHTTISIVRSLKDQRSRVQCSASLPSQGSSLSPPPSSERYPFFLSYFPCQVFSAILILKSLYIIFVLRLEFSLADSNFNLFTFCMKSDRKVCLLFLIVLRSLCRLLWITN